MGDCGVEIVVDDTESDNGADIGAGAEGAGGANEAGGGGGTGCFVRAGGTVDDGVSGAGVGGAGVVEADTAHSVGDSSSLSYSLEAAATGVATGGGGGGALCFVTGIDSAFS